jgi:prepilin-type N-terminal cleavage/methylation domain-containing protein
MTSTTPAECQSTASSTRSACSPPQARHAAPTRNNQQSGFTLIELIVVLAVIVALSTFVASKFTGDSSKAVKLFADMKTLSDSVQRAVVDLGGVPSKLSVLWNKADATSSNMYNGITATNSWSGPYIERQPTDSSNAITATSIADSTTIAIAREAANLSTNGGNLTWVYYLRASNVPNAVIIEAIKKCANTDTVANATFVNGQCRATAGTTVEYGTFDVKISDSR